MLQKNWKSLIQANKEIHGDEQQGHVASVVIEPLERGFAMTLGNALRRVLLSSLQGAAVTSIQIEGVLHEFSSVPGVREDVTDIIFEHQGTRPAHGCRRDAPYSFARRRPGAK